MSESETNEIASHETKFENSSRKRVRHRKKQLYENVLKQMEFYFSEANLCKDRFLGDLVRKDPYVPLETFLKFNKIRDMTQDIIDIAKAMKNSTLLELSEDRTKVKRKSPVQPYDADQRTVYVESIPVTASREWLQRVFSDYGDVAYISLPTFKNSRKIKGYGFIEFSNPEDAQKCINTFTKMGCKLPTSMPPEELSSIKMFSVEETSEEQAETKDREEDEPPKKKKKNNKKHKHLELKFEHEDQNEIKTETPTPTEENKSILSDDTKQEPGSESKEELTSQDESKAGGTPRKKKIRKRTAKERSKAKNKLGPNEAPKGALWGLQVLSKNEWKALRNKYLNLQRKYMKEMKMNLQNKRFGYNSIPAPAAPHGEVGSISNPHEDGSKTLPPLERIPGVFVKEVLPELCIDVKQTKRTIRSNIHVLHVDAKEGQSEVIIRFDSAKAASEYCVNSPCARVLTGEEESSQYQQAEAARGSRRARGRCRLVPAAACRLLPAAAAALAPSDPQPTHTHIRFDDQ